jgi:hypothetical protein
MQYRYGAVPVPKIIRLAPLWGILFILLLQITTVDTYGNFKTIFTLTIKICL